MGLISLLRGSALEEVRLCGEPEAPSELFTSPWEAYAEKHSVAQLLQVLYGCQQGEGEDFQGYSHALSQVLRLALKQSPDAVFSAKTAVRDQFIEDVQDSSLRRELRKMAREKPQSTPLDVQGGKPRLRPQFTEDGKPIYFKCKGVAHIARECTQCKLESQPITTSASILENYRQHLLGKKKDVFPIAKWLKLTAANSLLIPYMGYVELDMEAMGLNIPECGFQ